MLELFFFVSNYLACLLIGYISYLYGSDKVFATINKYAFRLCVSPCKTY
jgi:hypothetical protein